MNHDESNEKEMLEQIEHMQQKLRQQDKLASIGLLCAGISHEVQNPLNFVLNFSKLSLMLLEDLKVIADRFSERLDTNDAAELREITDDLSGNLEKIQEHGNRALSIVHGILMQSRGKEGEFLPTDTAALIHEYVWLSYHAMRAHNKNFSISIHEEYQTDMPKMLVVPQDLSRAVLNVMNNACYTVKERSERGEDGYIPAIAVKASFSGENSELVIVITDNGMGMSDEVKEKLFENFFTTKPLGQGTGLGMSIIRKIITEEHHGQLLIDSKEGEGTTFTFIIPVKTIN